MLLAAAGGGYRLAAESRQAILGKNDGGVYGDPFAGLEIKNRVLTLGHYGGSNWRWSLTAKFRFQQGAFYLIGRTRAETWTVGDECPESSDHRAGDSLDDENLLTGAYEEVKVS